MKTLLSETSTSEDHWFLPRQAWLIPPPLALYACDVTLTLLGQPAAYWQGDWAAYREFNPLAAGWLAQGPLVFAGWILAWGLCFSLILWLWRHPLVVVMAFILTLGHAVGASSWLIQHGWPGLLTAFALALGAQQALSWSWNRAGLYGRNLPKPLVR